MGNCLKRNIDNTELNLQDDKQDLQKSESGNNNQQNSMKYQVLQNQSQEIIQKNQQNNNKQQKNEKPLKSWEIRRQQQNFNKSDFKITKQENQTIIKLPGSINGQSFAIEDCKNCNIYIFDCMEQVFIDDCDNCRILIGPTSTSAFVRTTQNSKLIIACGQFRLRDCNQLQILLYCQSQPVIESSNQLQFGCYQMYYPELDSQFQKASLNPWKNNWSDIYNFTKNFNNGGLNYSYLSLDIDLKNFLQIPSDIFSIKPTDQQQNSNIILLEGSKDSINNKNNNNKSINFFEQSKYTVPVSLGMRQRQDYNNVLVMFDYSKQLDYLITKFNNQEDNLLTRSTVNKLNQEQIDNIGLNIQQNKCYLFTQIVSNNYNDIHININKWLREKFTNDEIDKIIIKIWIQLEDSIEMSNKIFENWNDERH